MEFRILGSLEVDDDHGLAVDLGGRQQRLVLAMLLLHRNEVVSVDRLIDVVWGERAPANAVKNVQIHVSRLRKALEATSPESVVQTRPNGYVLAVAPGELDVDRFERLLEEGRQALAAGEPALAETSLREALSLGRGEPLADFAYDSFAQGEIARLNELRLGAVEERLDAELALGRHDDVVAELQGLVAEHPLRERPRGQLMLALYRSGRKADALRVYDEARRSLAEELGLEPSESLQQLQRAVLTDDPSLAAPARIEPSRRPLVARAPLPLLAGRPAALIAIGGALVLAAALAVAALAVTRDQTSAGIVSVPPDSLAQIDPETNSVVAAVPVGARPATVVFSHGALWVANLDDDSVSRIDPRSRREAKRIPTSIAPIGLAGGRDAVWAIGGDGFVRRIDHFFNRVTRRIRTGRIGTVAGGGLMAGAVASTRDAVWVLSGGFLSVPRLYRVDPVEQQATEIVTTGDGPAAIAAGFGDLWVADSFENSVSRIEPSGAVAETIPVLRGASAVAVGEGAVWVAASLDNKLVRIDPQTNSVVTAIDVGRYPVGIAVGAGDVWVANRDDGTVSRIDPDSNEVVQRIPVGSRPAGIAFAAGSVWVTNQVDARPAAGRSDGTLRIRSSVDFETDPHANPEPQLAYLTCAKLLNHPDALAPAGTRLVPEVAAALPARSADGRTFTFTIRKGFAFSPPLREPVTAQTFVHSIERGTKLVAVHDPTLIVGQLAYLLGKAPQIAGVVAKGDKLSITLVRPASDEFLAQLAQPGYCAVPLNTPLDRSVPKLPSAGPYYVAQHEPDRRIVLKRNPNYHGSRPRRPRQIDVQIGGSPAQVFDDVLAGRADYTYEIPLSAGPERELAARYGQASSAARDGRQRYFVNPALALGALVLNTSRPLFADARLRKAVNYAIDRRALAHVGHFRFSGDFPAIPTAQYLPPTMPGASRTRLYPLGGDLRAARRLRPDASGTAVVYTCTHAQCRRQAQVIRSNLRELGLDVDIREFPYVELFDRASRPGEPYDILTAWELAEYADPANYLNDFLGTWHRPSPQLSAKLERAARLTGAARERAYAALSDEIALDVAPFVPYAAGVLRDFFSERVGCQVFHPVFRTDLAALCLRR